MRKYAIKKMIHAIKIERTGTDKQTKKAVRTQTNFMGAAFYGPGAHFDLSLNLRERLQEH